MKNKYSLDNLDQIIKSYDIRGLVASQITEEFMFDVGQAFGILMLSEDESEVLVGYDMRESSPKLAKSFSSGLKTVGIEVTNIGLVSTDALYFASGKFNKAGAMFTASHNPATYNGLKLCRALAKPIGEKTGLNKIKEILVNYDFVEFNSDRLFDFKINDILDDYKSFMLNSVDLSGIKKTKIVVDAGNGMAGLTVPRVFKDLKNIVIDELFFELDGSFPNHEANPLDPKNLVDLQNFIKNNTVDIGLAFDGDADRCFIVDENGKPITPSIIAAIISKYYLKLYPRSAIIYSLITSHIVRDTIEKNSGIGYRSRVGHSFIKQIMSEKNAIFGGEHSGHYYFKNFWNADSGMYAALIVLKILDESNKKLSDLVMEYQKYFNSGEINTIVDNPEKSMDYVVNEFKDIAESIDYLDGITVNLNNNTWFNIRKSNTEALLRLNVESNDNAEMQRLTKEILNLITK